MRAVTWQDRRKVSVETVPDPIIEQPTDAIVKITSTNICGSDLHLYETLGAFMTPGDVLGHEPMGIVEEVGREVAGLKPGDRVVMPFQISCGHCWMCDRELYTQCETTQVRDAGSGAALFGYSKLYGSVPGGQAEYLRVPQAQFTHIRVPEGPPDDRFVYLSDVLPTAWQAVEYAAVPDGGSLVVLGLGPIGDMACRVAQQKPIEQIIAVDLVPERLARARARGIEVIDLDEHGDDLGDVIRELTGGRGPDAVIDAVGMEAHGSPGAVARPAPRRAPARCHRRATDRSKAGVDRLAAVYSAIDIVRRGGTISLIGVYGGNGRPDADDDPVRQADPAADGPGERQEVGRRDHAAAVDDDPLGVDDFATHRLSLEDAPHAYDIFQRKAEGAVKIVLRP